MPKHPPSAPLRAQLRERIISRIAELKLKDFEAAKILGLSPGQFMYPVDKGQACLCADNIFVIMSPWTTRSLTTVRPSKRTS